MTRRIVRVVLFCGLLVLLINQTKAQEGIKLRYQYSAGEELRYKFVMDIVMSLDMNFPGVERSAGNPPLMSGQIVGIMKQKTKKIMSNGDAQVTFNYEQIKMTMEGKTETIPAEKFPEITLVLSNDGKITDIKWTGGQKIGPGMSSDPLSLMNFEGTGYPSAFPSEPVRVDDTWTSEIPSPMGDGKINVSSKVLSLNTKIGGYTAAKIQQDMSGNIGLNIPMPNTTNSQGSSMTGTLTINGTGIIYHSIDKGKLIKTEWKGDVVTAMEVSLPEEDNAGTMTVNMEMKYVMYLLPKK
ncbi:MAG: hypothetical protein K6U00_08685 [Armatimonadetes bacterium]|nr:hypothetical protein [Armatimonadota bacterium]